MFSNLYKANIFTVTTFQITFYYKTHTSSLSFHSISMCSDPFVSGTYFNISTPIQSSLIYSTYITFNHPIQSVSLSYESSLHSSTPLSRLICLFYCLPSQHPFCFPLLYSLSPLHSFLSRHHHHRVMKLVSSISPRISLLYR